MSDALLAIFRVPRTSSHGGPVTSQAAYWATAQLVCTKKQLAALSLRDTLNLSERQIAHVLGVSRGTIRDHLDAADRKIHAALKETAA